MNTCVCMHANAGIGPVLASESRSLDAPANSVRGYSGTSTCESHKVPLDTASCRSPVGLEPRPNLGRDNWPGNQLTPAPSPSHKSGAPHLLRYDARNSGARALPNIREHRRHPRHPRADACSRPIFRATTAAPLSSIPASDHRVQARLTFDSRVHIGIVSFRQCACAS
jgi:hypothetical protein